MKPKALYLLEPNAFKLIYGHEARARIAQRVEIPDEPIARDVIRENLSMLQDVEIIFSGWGGPHLDEEFLAAAPKLKLVLYGAGSIRGLVSEAFWERGIAISNAAAQNAEPVAEYTLSQILFSLKNGWRYSRVYKTQREGADPFQIPGAFRSTVGIISLGLIGRRVCQLLEPFDLMVLAYDPFVPALAAAELGVALCDLERLFSEADVVSLHAPNLPETRGMITGDHFTRMKSNATFINTARGAIVREDELCAVLAERPDLTAVLDVTDPEPPRPDSPLWTLPNVVLTPHIAGSQGRECQRMGEAMADELERWLQGNALQQRVTPEMFARMA